MKITVFSDCHWFGPTPSKVKPEFGKNVYYIGDNHEFKNIPKKRIKHFERVYKGFLISCKNSETNVLNGNHEVSVGADLLGVNSLSIPNKNAMLIHGDLVLWPNKKFNSWREKKPGKSRRVIFGIKIKNLWRNRKGSTKLSQKKIELFSEFAKNMGVKTIIFGHTHPKRLIDETHNGIRIINVPRGKTEIIL